MKRKFTISNPVGLRRRKYVIFMPIRQVANLSEESRRQVPKECSVVN